MNHFELFDLKPSFELDGKALDERYRALSQQWHPDKVQGGDAKARDALLLRPTEPVNARRDRTLAGGM